MTKYLDDKLSGDHKLCADNKLSGGRQTLALSFLALTVLALTVRVKNNQH
jgi:hypothetical protein